MATSKSGVSVFISYSRSDVERARTLQAELTSQGFSVWRDQSSVYGGERWPKVLGEAVAESDVLLLLWSESAADSNFVELEWCTALALRKPIVPILLEETTLPPSLSAINAVPRDIGAADLGRQLRRRSRTADTRGQKNRRAIVFTELDTEDADVGKLAAKVHARADQLSTRRYLLLELARALLVPLLVSSALALGATAFVWDNPFRLDANLVLFAAMTGVPVAILLTLAFVLRTRTAKLLSITAMLAVVGVMTWYQPRIVAGPVVSVDQPSVVVLFHNAVGADAYAAQLIDEVMSLPATMFYEDYEFPVQSFVYRRNPDASYVNRAILRNPFIRTVVKVYYESRDSIVIRTEVPSPKAWRGLKISYVSGVSHRGEFGVHDQTNLLIDRNRMVRASTEVSRSFLDHRLGGFSGGLGFVNPDGAIDSNLVSRDDRLFRADAASFKEKLRFAILVSYMDFVREVLGDTSNLPCETFSTFEEISRESALDEFAWMSVACAPIAELAQRFVEGSIDPDLQARVTNQFVSSAMSGFPELSEAQREHLLGVPQIAVADEIFRRCGTGYRSITFETTSSARFVSDEAARSVSCLFDTLAANADPFPSDPPETVIVSMATAYTLGLIPNPEERLDVVNRSIDTWCDVLETGVSDLVFGQIFKSTLRPVLDRWNSTSCAPLESVPRLIRLAEFLDANMASINSAIEIAERTMKIDQQLHHLLVEALDAIAGNSPTSAVNELTLNKFVADFNEDGACAALRGLAPRLESEEFPDADAMLQYICKDDFDSVLAHSLSYAQSSIAELPIGNAPVLLKQLVTMGFIFDQLGETEPDGDDASADVADDWLRQLPSYKAGLAHLNEYFPELDATGVIALELLDTKPVAEQLEYLTKRLERGNSRMLSAYLAEAQLAAGDDAAAVSIFRNLEEDSRSSVRKDYYATRIAALTGEKTCGSIGDHVLTVGDTIEPGNDQTRNYEHYASLLRNAGVETWDHEIYLMLLSQAPGLDFYRSLNSFGDSVSAVYAQLGETEVERARDESPGIFLRLMIVDEFASSAGRAEQEQIIATFANERDEILRSVESCRDHSATRRGPVLARVEPRDPQAAGPGRLANDSDDESEATGPAALTDFRQTLRVRRAWSSSIGTGSERQRLGVGPAGDDDRLYTAAYDGRVTALDPDTGEHRWQIDLGAGITAGPGLGERIVVVVDADENLIALDAEDGTELWSTYIDAESIVAPLVHDGLVFVRAQRDHNLLLAYTVDGGVERWGYIGDEPPALTLHGMSRPAIVGELVVAGFDSGELLAVEALTGVVRWENALGKPTGTSAIDRIADLDGPIAIVGQDLYTAAGGRIAAVAAESGQILWLREIPTYTGVSADWNSVYTTTASGEIVAIERRTGSEIWRMSDLIGREPSPPVAVDGNVVVTDLEGYVHFFAGEDGEPLARVRAGEGLISGAPLLQGNKLLVQSESGILEAFLLPVR